MTITDTPVNSVPEPATWVMMLAGVFGGVPFHAWMKGGYLRLMPYWLDAR